jgi:hypothetical protein
MRHPPLSCRLVPYIRHVTKNDDQGWPHPAFLPAEALVTMPWNYLPGLVPTCSARLAETKPTATAAHVWLMARQASLHSRRKIPVLPRRSRNAGFVCDVIGQVRQFHNVLVQTFVARECGPAARPFDSFSYQQPGWIKQRRAAKRITRMVRLARGLGAPGACAWSADRSGQAPPARSRHGADVR